MTSSEPHDRQTSLNQDGQGSVDRKSDDLEQIQARIEFDEAIAAGALQGPLSLEVDPAFGAVIRLLHGCLSPVEQEEQLIGRESWQLPNPFGRFEVHEKIGEGAFGAVWKAFDPQLQRILAIKVLHPELRIASTVSHRFVKEARAAARLNHPNIVRIHDAGNVDGISYIAAEFVQGRKLEVLDRNGPRFDPHQSAELIAQLAAAISHSHSEGVIHRDIKPDNVLLDVSIDTNGHSRTIPRLTDFGLARIQDDDSAQSTLGMLVGTVQYMSPEQLQGGSSYTESSTDIYALGILLYEMLTGRRPRPNATNVFQTIEASRLIASPRAVFGKRIPADINAICMRCLAYDPKSRYPSADELHSDLKRFMDGRPTNARPRSTVQHIVSWCSLHKLAAFTIGAAVTTLALALVVFAWTTEQLARQNEQLKTAWASTESSALVAKEHERRYRNLAWTSNIQRAYSFFEERRFPAVDQVLLELAESHSDETSRPEWQLLQGELIQNYRSLYQADFSLREVVRIPHSDLIAFAGDSPTVFLMEISSGKIAARFETAVSQIHALACSRDGEKLAFGGTTAKDSDRAFPWLIHLKSGDQTQVNAPSITTIESLSFSLDNQWLAVASRYENAKLVPLGEPGLTPVEVANSRRGESIDWLYGSKEAVIHSDHGQLTYQQISGKLRTQDVEAGPFLAFAAVPNSNKIAISGTGESCYVLDGENSLTLKTLDDARPPPTCIAASEGGQWVATGLVNGEVLMWDISTNDERVSSANLPSAPSKTIFARAQARLLDSRVTALCWFNDDLIVAGEGGHLVLWSPSKTQQSVSGRFGVTAACFDSKENQIILGFSDGSLRRYNNDELYRQLLERCPKIEDFGSPLLSSRSSTITLLTMASSGKWIAAAYADNHLELLDSTGHSIVSENGVGGTSEENATLAVAISYDDRWIAWGGTSNELFVRRFDGIRLSGGFTVQLTSDINSLAFLRDSKSISVSGQFEGVRVYDLNTGESIRQLGSSSNMAIAAKNEQSLVIGSTEGVIRTMGLEDRALSDEIRTGFEPIGAMAVSPCNSIVISLSDSLDVHVTLLSASTHLGRLFKAPVGNQKSKYLFQAVQFSSDNRYVFVLQGFRNRSHQTMFQLYPLSPLSSSMIEKPVAGSLRRAVDFDLP